MINAKGNKDIMKLQKDIAKLLNEYNNYISPELERYEKNFQPHITIATNLDDKKLNDALADLNEDFQCIGEITEVVLPCVNKISVKESKNPKNLTIYKL